MYAILFRDILIFFLDIQMFWDVQNIVFGYLKCYI